jgi:uncharacterized protein
LNSALTGEQLERIEAFSIERCSGHDAAHDALHLRRVLANARAIADNETGSGASIRNDVVEAACWLHDLVQLPKGTGPAGEPARLSALSARQLLTDMSVHADTVDRIVHAIEAHSFSGGMKPATIEAAIVQDADRLDALGAVGIARLWVTAAMLGSQLYNATDPLGASRALDDRAYGFDHIERKLATLSSTMNTPSGRSEADRRSAYVLEYRAEFARELGGGVPNVLGSPHG